MLIREAVDKYILGGRTNGLPKMALLVLLVTTGQSVSAPAALTEYISQNTVHRLSRGCTNISAVSLSAFLTMLRPEI